jgi:DNA-binding CsgD family transcriptional regulator
MATIDQIYEAVSDDEAYSALPAAIAALAGARSCSMLAYDRTLQITASNACHFTPEMYDFQKDPEVARLDVWSAHGAQPHLMGKVNDCEDAWDIPTFLRTPYYNECIRNFGDDSVHCMGGIIRFEEGYLALAVHSGLGAKRFDKRQAAIVGEHMPHIFRMLQLRARLNEARAGKSLLQNALDQMAGGVVALDRTMRVRALNGHASAMLAAGDGVRLVGGRLAATDSRLQDRLSHAVRSAATWTNGRGDAILLTRQPPAPAYRVLVSPMAGPQPYALLIIEDPAQSDPSLAATLASLFGLTTSEAELAALLAEGATPEEAAETRAVRLSTVRTQIQSLLHKTEARRLTDLIRLLARAPRRAG